MLQRAGADDVSELTSGSCCDRRLSVRRHRDETEPGGAFGIGRAYIPVRAGRASHGSVYLRANGCESAFRLCSSLPH